MPLKINQPSKINVIHNVRLNGALKALRLKHGQVNSCIDFLNKSQDET